MQIVSETQGHHICATSTAANGNEREQVEELLKKVGVVWNKLKTCARQMPILEADRGYDSHNLRQKLLSIGIFPLIPRRKMTAPNPMRPSMTEVHKIFNLKSQGWKVERAIAWLTSKCRRLLMRWERLQEIWASFVSVALIYYWLNILVG